MSNNTYKASEHTSWGNAIYPVKNSTDKIGDVTVCRVECFGVYPEPGDVIEFPDARDMTQTISVLVIAVVRCDDPRDYSLCRVSFDLDANWLIVPDVSRVRSIFDTHSAMEKTMDFYEEEVA